MTDPCRTRYWQRTERSMSRIQCKGCNYKPSKHDTLSGYCMTCADSRIVKYEQLESEIAGLKAALQANTRKCEYFDGDKLCLKIARHMFDDYDISTEYYCDEHKDEEHFAKNYSGIFKPSELAEKALK